jgi:hypothetical protein
VRTSLEFVYVIAVVAVTEPSPAAVVVEAGSTLLGVLELGKENVVRVSLAVPMQDGDVPEAQADAAVRLQTAEPFAHPLAVR